MTTKIMPKMLFECDCCSRCGATGMWSPGRVCFKCSGNGWLLTKRGAMAQAFLNKKRRVTVETLQVGDKILDDRRWWTIKSIEVVDNQFHIDLVDTKKVEGDLWSTARFTLPAGSEVRKALPKSVTDALIAEALAYQATLTKHGKPSKASTKKSSK